MNLPVPVTSVSQAAVTHHADDYEGDAVGTMMAMRVMMGVSKGDERETVKE